MTETPRPRRAAEPTAPESTAAQRQRRAAEPTVRASEPATQPIAPAMAAPRSAAPGGLGDMTEALQIRQQGARRRRNRRLAVLLGSLALLIAAVVVIIFTPLFRVQEVAVSGNSFTTTQEILDAADVEMDAPLVRTDINAIAARVATLHAVAEVTVTKQWPHTIDIAISERSLVFQIDTGTGFQWVSADGVIFHVAENAEPVFTAEVASTDQSLLSDVATVIAALPPEVAPLVQLVIASSQDLIMLQLNDGRQVIWGSADDSAQKAEVLVPLLQVGGTTYDISAPSNPAVK